MVTAAAGPITEIETQWQTMLATCTQVQTWLGVGSVAAAQAKIYFDGPPAPTAPADARTKAQMVGLRPFITIWTEEENGIDWQFDSAKGFDARGTLVAQLEENYPSEDIDEAARLFKNMLGQTILSGDSGNPGLIELAWNAPHLNLASLSFRGPFRADPNRAREEGDHQWAYLIAEWGGFGE